MNINNSSLTPMKNIRIGQQLNIEEKTKDATKITQKTSTTGLDTFTSCHDVDNFDAVVITTNDVDMDEKNNNDNNACYTNYDYSDRNSRGKKGVLEVAYTLEHLEVGDTITFKDGTYRIDGFHPDGKPYGTWTKKK